jgi:hypothetical protein
MGQREWDRWGGATRAGVNGGRGRDDAPEKKRFVALSSLDLCWSATPACCAVSSPALMRLLTRLLPLLPLLLPSIAPSPSPHAACCCCCCCPGGWCHQSVTWRLKEAYPGRLLTAEITPEDPNLMKAYGFDAIWVHSGYFGGCPRGGGAWAAMFGCIAAAVVEHV